MHKYRIAVLRGGPSEEYDVSLRTGESVLAALESERYEPLDVVITRAGEWLLQGRVREPHELLASVDGVFIALHGAYGEGGTLQRLIERLHVPYTGSRAFPSAVARSKAIAKDRLAQAGVRMPRHMLVGASARDNVQGLADSIAELFGPKYIVKPTNSGASLGVRIAENRAVLPAVLSEALAEYEQVLVEEYIAGREATCGVVENFRGERLYALPSVEIIPPSGAVFFDYQAKCSASAGTVCPSTFSLREKDELAHLARLAHETLELSQYSRSDFIVGKDGIYFLETNTLPWLTENTPIQKALEVVGCPYEHFVNHLMADALESERAYR